MTLPRQARGKQERIFSKVRCYTGEDTREQVRKLSCRFLSPNLPSCKRINMPRQAQVPRGQVKGIKYRNERCSVSRCRRPLLRFVTSACAIVGGMLSTMGILDKVVLWVLGTVTATGGGGAGAVGAAGGAGLPTSSSGSSSSRFKGGVAS